ncbi:MAG: alkaline phosphatase family protein [Chloroflexi bacterium]|nr:alkaline phosphatase family protein [Chloroflexota bacterium]
MVGGSNHRPRAALEPGGDIWQKVIEARGDHERFTRIMEATGLPTDMPPLDIEKVTPATFAQYALMADHRVFDWVGALAASDEDVDLIITEVGMPDGAQHSAGYKSEYAHFAIAYADMLVGKVVQRLASAGKLGEYNLAIMADHGHSPIERAIYTDNLLPGVNCAPDGSMPHVAAESEAQLQEVTEKLAEFGVEPWNKDHIPDDFKHQLSVFVAPDGVEIIAKPVNPEDKSPRGQAGTSLQPRHSSWLARR